MVPDRPASWLVTAAASGVIALVATSVVFVGPSQVETVSAALAAWIPLCVGFGAAGVNPEGLSRFVVVFCGSLVGLTLLVSLISGVALEVAFYGGRLAVPINPVMAVLVGGAVALAYYGVFEWGTDTNDGTPA